MAQQYRYSHQRPRQGGRGEERDWGRGDPNRSASDRDRYQAGDEQRFNPDWEGDRGQERAFQGDRSYGAGGYAEETGYGRHERGRDRGYPYQGSGPSGSSGSWRDPDYRGNPSAGSREDPHLYRDFLSHWDRDREDQGYFGTGHEDGVSGTSPGTRATSGGYDFYGPSTSGEDFYGRRSYAQGEGDWRENESRWRNERGGRMSSGQSGYGREQSGAPWPDRTPGRNYGWQRGGSYGPQSSYGRNSPYSAADMSGRYSSADSPSQGPSQGYRQSSPGRPAQSMSGDVSGYGAGAYNMQQQSYRGKGPKGYQRSDDRLKEIICEQLMEDPDIDASEVNIEVAGSVVTLTGAIEDRRTKYEIEDIIERIGGVRDINNQLRVQSASSRSQSSTPQSAGSTSSSRGGAGQSTSGSTSVGSTSGSSPASSGSSTKKN